MTRILLYLRSYLARHRLFRQQAELARRELDRQPRAMTAEIEREHGRDGMSREVVEVFRRNEGGL